MSYLCQTGTKGSIPGEGSFLGARKDLVTILGQFDPKLVELALQGKEVKFDRCI
jgi:hypothetical protein